MLFMKPERFVERVFLHCSASDNPDHDDVSVMRRWHTDPEPEGRAWSDVGYHLFIRKSGQVQEGRPLSRIPAAQGGNNTGTIAICLHGLAKEKFTREQFASVHDLSRQINRAYDAGATFHGHCEVSAKLCPVFDYKDVLGLDEFGAIVGEGFRVGGPAVPDVPPRLRRTIASAVLITSCARSRAAARPARSRRSRASTAAAASTSTTVAAVRAARIQSSVSRASDQPRSVARRASAISPRTKGTLGSRASA